MDAYPDVIAALKQLDYDIVQGTSSSGLINRIKKTGQYGRSQSNKFRRNTGSVNRRGKTGIPRRAKGLGGLVKWYQDILK